MRAMFLLAAWRRSAIALGAFGLLLLGGCTTTSLVLGAAGVATDTSIPWAIVKHVHAKITEGDDAPCHQLDSVQRALNPRCGAFVPGSLRAADLQRPALQGCVLAVAARDPRLWPVLPELLAKGAAPAACARSPLAELAQALDCPDFNAASPDVLAALRGLALADPRAVSHDVMRLLSCPSAIQAGLGDVLGTWLARGDLALDRVAFGPLGALQPSYLGSAFAQALEARGHTAQAALGGYEGVQPRGFELALRQSDWAALEWWLARAPALANRVPPAQGGQLPWVPLARVLQPKFLDAPAGQREMVAFLMARGADPWQKLPYDRNRSVVEYARGLNSPLVAALDPPAAPSLVVVAAEAPRGAPSGE